MKIESLEKYKGKTFEVLLENGDKYFWHLDVISQYHLKEGSNIPDGVVEEICFANDFRRAKERALYLLDYRDYSYAELFKKLEQNYDEDVCFKVMDRMVEIGAVDDRRYAESLAGLYAEKKKYGYYRVVQEMRRRGLDSDIIEEAWADYEDTEYERLLELIEQKYLYNLEDEKSIKKVKNALARYGYSFDKINAAIREFTEE